jgi:TonB family protein
MLQGACRLVSLVFIGLGLPFLTAAQGNRVKVLSDPPPPAAPAPKLDYPSKENTSTEKPEAMPAFRGKIKEFYAKNMKHPVDAKGKERTGVAVVAFVIEADGLVSDVHLGKTSGDALLDAEALRLVGQMESKAYWKPGMHHGTPVAVYYTLAIRFKPAEQPKLFETVRTKK